MRRALTPTLVIVLLAAVVPSLACSRRSSDTSKRSPSLAVESDTVGLERWKEPRYRSPADAIAAGEREGLDRLKCPLGLASGTCDGYSFVAHLGGFTNTTYYFDASGLVGVHLDSDVPTPPTRFGLVPTCAKPESKKLVCKSD